MRSNLTATTSCPWRGSPALFTSSYEAELVEAYEHVRRLVALLPQPRARGDEPAHIFDPARFGPTTD